MKINIKDHRSFKDNIINNELISGIMVNIGKDFVIVKVTMTPSKLNLKNIEKYYIGKNIGIIEFYNEYTGKYITYEIYVKTIDSTWLHYGLKERN